jgi:lysophospholipase L1-like esterase
MHRLVTIALLACLATSLVGCGSGAAAPNGTVKVVTIGDSNTSPIFTQFGQGQPWPVRLQSALAAAYPSTTYTLDNWGIASADSGDGVANATVFANLHADIYIVMYGTNDVVARGSVPQHTTSQSASNLRVLLSALSNTNSTNNLSGKPLVVLMQPPPAVSKAVFDAHQTTMPNWRARDSSECAQANLVDFKNLVSLIAKQNHVPAVPVWDSTYALGFDGSQTSQTTQAKYLYDGVHLSEKEQGNISAWALAAIARCLTRNGTGAR